MNSKESMEDNMYRPQKEGIRAIVYNSIITMKSYWTSAGLRVEDANEFQKCMQSVKQISLGEGAFGSVVKMPAQPCLSRNIPKGVKKVAVKTEKVRPFFFYGQMPDRIQNAVVIAKKAAALHIAPQMYDAFIVMGDDGIITIVKVQEVIEGKPWKDIVWKSNIVKAAALDR